MRTRAPLFVLLVLLAGGIAAGVGAAGTATATTSGYAPEHSTLHPRLDGADATSRWLVVAGVRDATRERDSRRLDAAALAGLAALALAAAWLITRRRHAPHRNTPRPRGNRTRAPPALPAFVCT